MPVFCLSFHQSYRCQHAGACCRAGWHIPVEEALRPRLGTAVLSPDASGTCTRYDVSARRCQIHRDAGAAALPLSCDQFPRVSLTDDRGIFITLSHFCPTAAALLFAPGDLRVIENPAGFPAARRYDGLDARGAWAPLVRERLLFGLDDYSRWERWMVAVFAAASTPALALARIAHAAERLRAWTPAAGTFADWLTVTCAIESEREDERLPRGIYDDLTSLDIVAQIPEMAGIATLPALPALLSAPFNRYLAAKAFGSWSAYQGRGIRTTVAELVVSDTVLRSEMTKLAHETPGDVDAAMFTRAVRAADWRLVHSLDRGAFTAWLSRVETR